MPDGPEAKGLLALMLLAGSRRDAMPVNCEGTGRPLRENGGNPLQTTGAGQASACLLHHSHPQ